MQKRPIRTLYLLIFRRIIPPNLCNPIRRVLSYYTNKLAVIHSNDDYRFMRVSISELFVHLLYLEIFSIPFNSRNYYVDAGVPDVHRKVLEQCQRGYLQNLL